MAFSCRLNYSMISAFKPQNLNVQPSIQPSSYLPSFSSFKVQNFPFRVRYAPTIRATSSSSSPPTTIAKTDGFKINSIPTKPIEGQKTGTSVLRKKVKVFMQENYLANWIQALFNLLPPEDYKNGLLLLGGDGRYFNRKAAQIIIKIVAGNGVGKIFVGKEGILSTPAVSAVIRKRKANGGFVMSASRNPGGPEYNWGIKFNYSNGQPAPESITDKIYRNTLSGDQASIIGGAINFVKELEHRLLRKKQKS